MPCNMSQMKRTMTQTRVLGNLRYRARCGSCSAASNVSRSFSREAEVWHSTLWFFSQNKSRWNFSTQPRKLYIQRCGFRAKFSLLKSGVKHCGRSSCFQKSFQLMTGKIPANASSSQLDQNRLKRLETVHFILNISPIGHMGLKLFQKKKTPSPGCLKTWDKPRHLRKAQDFHFYVPVGKEGLQAAWSPKMSKHDECWSWCQW